MELCPMCDYPIHEHYADGRARECPVCPGCRSRIGACGHPWHLGPTPTPATKSKLMVEVPPSVADGMQHHEIVRIGYPCRGEAIYMRSGVALPYEMLAEREREALHAIVRPKRKRQWLVEECGNRDDGAFKMPMLNGAVVEYGGWVRIVREILPEEQL